MNTSDEEYAAHLAFRRNILQIHEEFHRREREQIDEEINRIGQKLGVQETEKRERPKDLPQIILEGPFNALKYEVAKGERLGEYGVCYKNSNNHDAFQHCFNVLKANSATIKNHFSEPSWTHFYWLYLEKYDDRFFRKKKKE